MLETSVGQKPNSPYANSVMMISILKWVSTTCLNAFCHLEGRGGFFFLLAPWEKMTTKSKDSLACHFIDNYVLGKMTSNSGNVL